MWLTLPLTLGDLLAGALDARSGVAATTATLTAWLLWSAGLVASLVTLPVTLTLWRVLAPLPVLAGLPAAVEQTPSALGWIGLSTAAVVSVAVMAADIGDDFVNGSSYGDERRMALRPPAVLLLGPVEGVWLLTVAPILAGIGLIGAQQWVLGGGVIVVGAATAWWGARILHRLSCRWIVFVPAGITLVDSVALAEPTLFRRDTILRLGPAPADTTALDLSAGASGLIVQIDLDTPAPLLPAAGRGGTSTPIESASVLLAPTRPGAMLALAQERRIAVQRA
jgi:hypothetical protein